jgi:hypothetical protein
MREPSSTKLRAGKGKAPAMEEAGLFQTGKRARNFTVRGFKRWTFLVVPLHARLFTPKWRRA